MYLVQETKFIKTRKRGTVTRNNSFSLFLSSVKNIDNFTFIKNNLFLNNQFIWFYRDPRELLNKISLQDLNKIDESIIFSMHPQDKKWKLSSTQIVKWNLLNNQGSIYTNGFYYGKKYGFKKYFLSLPLDILFLNIKKSKENKTGIYVRPECVINKTLLQEMPNLILYGKDIYNREEFFSNINSYLFIPCEDDAVPNTAIEAIMLNKTIIEDFNYQIWNQSNFYNGNGYFEYKELFESDLCQMDSIQFQEILLKLQQLFINSINNQELSNFLQKRYNENNKFIDFIKEIL